MQNLKGIIANIKNACIREKGKQEVMISTSKDLINILDYVSISMEAFKVRFEELSMTVDSIKAENVINALVSKSGESGIVLPALVKEYGLQRLPTLWGNLIKSCDELDELLVILGFLSEEGASKDTHGGSLTTDDDPKDDE